MYFKNLNGLRFIAAFAVVISHIEQVKEIHGISSFHNNFYFSSIGKLGVVLFFVLSGFLITYLLLIEKQKNKTINIKNFYLRRILRIWPLYYIIVLIGLFIMPKIGITEFILEPNPLINHFYTILFLFIIFLPNFVLVNFGGIPFLHQTWSIGTEEQFYLFWPLLLYYSKNILKAILIVCIIYLFIKFTFYSLKNENEFFKLTYQLWTTFSVFSLGIGSLVAYVVHNHKIRLKNIFNNWISYLLLLISFTVQFVIQIFEPAPIRMDIFSIIFGLFILKLSIEEKKIFILENKISSYMGKISYGIYMLHPIAIAIVFCFLGNLKTSILIYILTFAITFILSLISYEFFESFFLKLKVKYFS